MSTPLARILRRRIALAGPITVADFMGEALGHPEHGYYVTRDPLGARGDFITAPEISQVFGELIGLWCAEIWLTALAPRPVNLVELGPGRGTLMADALRAARMAPGFLEAASVHLVETSPALRAKQRRSLSGREAVWHDRIESIPDGPVLLVANEFFDALPVRQFELTKGGWRERMVGLDESGERFRIGLAPAASPSESLVPAPVRATARCGDIAETCPAGLAIVHSIAARLAEFGGAALIVDYGHPVSAPGDTLQALRGHARHDPLEDPGEADLTAHVDFGALAGAARDAGAASHGPVTQGELLTRLGIGLREAQLLRAATPVQAEGIRTACRRLIAPEEMGTLFKAMALTPAGAQTPPGFEAPGEGNTAG